MGYFASILQYYMWYVNRKGVPISQNVTQFISNYIVITGTLCTHAILKGLGVGNDNINAYSATVTWILKEGSGHLGRILFSWWKGAQLDIDSKKWRLRADFLNDMAMGIEIYVLPKYPHLATQILCGTTVLKAIVGVAGEYQCWQHETI